jgi:hypothetical protein
VVDTLPEPGDPRLVRVSDAEREHTVEVLRQAVVDGRLTLEELEPRVGLAYTAKSRADLDSITSDLPGSAKHPAASPAAEGVQRRRSGPTASVAIMSGATRSGRWVVPPHYSAVAIMGGVDLDLRHATFAQDEATITAYCFMGGVTIVVPEDLEVDVSGMAFMGGFEHSATGPGRSPTPVLRVTGFAFMGGVEVKRRPADEASQPAPRAIH